MVSVKLAKPWLQYAIGDTVEVDPMRAQWLRENGYEATPTVLKVGNLDLSEHVVSADLDIIPRGSMVSPRVRKESKLREPVPDLDIKPPVTELDMPASRELKIQPNTLPLVLTETQIKDAGEGPAMVEEHIRQTLNKPLSED